MTLGDICSIPRIPQVGTWASTTVVLAMYFVVLVPTVGMFLWVVYPRTGRKPVHEDPGSNPRP